MFMLVRRMLIVAALTAITGCSGAATIPPGSTGTQTSISVVRSEVPMSPFAHRGVAARISPTNYPTGASLVFEADPSAGGVNIYQTSKLSTNPAPIASISSVPYGLAADKTGTIYVANRNGNNGLGEIDLYPKGSTTIKSSIKQGINQPLGITIDASGTLYVANAGNVSITEYAHGTSVPSKAIFGGGMAYPFGLAVDKSGNLYIADSSANSGAGSVFELPAGGSSVTNLNLKLASDPVGVAISPKTGYLWVTSPHANVIGIYNVAKQKTPLKSIKGNGYPFAISIQQSGTPLGETIVSDLTTTPGSVSAYKPGHYTPYATLTNGIQTPEALLITKP